MTEMIKLLEEFPDSIFIRQLHQYMSEKSIFIEKVHYMTKKIEAKKRIGPHSVIQKKKYGS